MRLRPLLVSVLVPLLVLGAVVGVGRWASARTPDTRSSLTSALDVLPADTSVAGFTDWSTIRRHLRLGRASTAAARAALTDRAALRDLSTRSVLGQSVEEMHRAYGWSAADLDWEVYGQAQDGAAVVARLDRSVPMSTVRARLRALGYVESGGVWTLADGADTVSQELASTLGALALVPASHLVVAGDRPAYVSTVLRVVDRHASSLLSVRAAADVAATLVGTDAALLQDGPFACAAARVTDTAADVRAQARAAVQRAGTPVAPRFAGRGIVDERTSRQSVRFAFGFGSAARATQQRGVREALASGPVIGGTGRVEDSLRLAGASVDGTTLTLRFSHPPDSAVQMTADSPLLLAGCPVA